MDWLGAVERWWRELPDLYQALISIALVVLPPVWLTIRFRGRTIIHLDPRRWSCQKRNGKVAVLGGFQVSSPYGSYLITELALQAKWGRSSVSLEPLEAHYINYTLTDVATPPFTFELPDPHTDVIAINLRVRLRDAEPVKPSETPGSGD